MNRAIGLLVLAGVVSLTACLPPIMHGPEVQEGWRGLVAAGAGIGPEAADDPWSVVPVLVGGIGRGWQGERAALSIVAQAPLIPHWEALQFAGSVDVYVQPDRSRPMGAGVLGSYSVLMPYAQLGFGDDGAWYTTQGVAFIGREFREGMYWVPGIAFRQERPDGSRAATVWLNGGAGFGDSEPDALVTVGVLFDFGARR